MNNPIYDYVRILVSMAPASGMFFPCAHVGAYCDVSSGGRVWKWLSEVGIPVSSVFWSTAAHGSEEPANQAGDENCGCVFSTLSWRLADVQCNAWWERPYVCETNGIV